LFKMQGWRETFDDCSDKRGIGFGNQEVLVVLCLKQKKSSEADNISTLFGKTDKSSKVGQGPRKKTKRWYSFSQQTGIEQGRPSSFVNRKKLGEGRWKGRGSAEKALS